MPRTPLLPIIALSLCSAPLQVQAQTQTPQEEAAKYIDFGDDTSEWARDGECDDMRFTGPGMTDTPLLEEDIGHDAHDCRLGFEAGRLTMRGQTDSVPDFGTDEGDWANDGECDDPRFAGAGMTDTPLLEEDVMRDATDCRTAYNRGELTLR